MHRYEELEKLYYKKKIKKFLVLLIAFILILIIILLLFNSKKKSRLPKENNISKVIEKNLSKQIEKKLSKKIEKNISKKNFQISKTVEKNLTPVFSFYIPKIDFNVTDNENNDKIEKNKKKIKKMHKIVKKRKKDFLIVEEKVSVKDLINSFDKNPSFDLAIDISKYYLDKNYLDLAKKWALKANAIDSSRYESWKIFAIILLKKNEKEKAKEVLKTYINDYGKNKEIEELLRSING